MLFFRVFQHLLPDGQAWRLTITKTLRKFFEALSQPPEVARAYVDAVFEDAFPDTTRELAEWEAQFGLDPNPDDAIRRLNLAAAWASGGGQDPAYIQGVLQTAGFDLYIHEWWEPGGPPYVARDPHLYTTRPLIGTWQCTGYDAIHRPRSGQPQCSALGSQPQCNKFLANDPHYIVNKDLTRRPPPPIPERADREDYYWRFFFYVGGETFPDIAEVPASRREEFEKLILKLRPSQQWIVTLIRYTGSGGGVFDDTFDVTFE